MYTVAALNTHESGVSFESWLGVLDATQCCSEVLDHVSSSAELGQQLNAIVTFHQKTVSEYKQHIALRFRDRAGVRQNYR